jgi:hypothetical protein
METGMLAEEQLGLTLETGQLRQRVHHHSRARAGVYARHKSSALNGAARVSKRCFYLASRQLGPTPTSTSSGTARS